MRECATYSAEGRGRWALRTGMRMRGDGAAVPAMAGRTIAPPAAAHHPRHPSGRTEAVGMLPASAAPTAHVRPPAAGSAHVAHSATTTVAVAAAGDTAVTMAGAALPATGAMIAMMGAATARRVPHGPQPATTPGMAGGLAQADLSHAAACGATARCRGAASPMAATRVRAQAVALIHATPARYAEVW